MRNARHTGRAGADYDKKFDFASPDARGTSQRTADHRYLPADLRQEVRSTRRTQTGSDDVFSSLDFRARWWPAPDVSN